MKIEINDSQLINDIVERGLLGGKWENPSI
jgi:hypothetical protein